MSKKRTVSPLAKLSPRKVKAARRWRLAGASQAEIAAKLDVSQPTISVLLRGITYRGVA